MNYGEELTKEQKLLLMAGRRTITESEKKEIREIVSFGVNMFEVVKYAMYHKVATLFWYNMTQIVPDVKLPKYMYSLLRYSFYDIAAQNELYCKETKRLTEELANEGIAAIPVKGAYLVPRIYKPLGIRYMGDIDFLVKKTERNHLDKVLTELGYMKGNYNSVTKKIEPISRAEDIKWKMAVTNFYPYRKLTEDEKNPIIKLDFRYSLDDSLSPDPINEIVDAYDGAKDVNPAHVLIHLCAHFYAEAKHVTTIYMCKDLCLIKLCDIREYILAYATKEDFDEMIAFAKKYDLLKQVYFTFFYLNLTYGDEFCKEVMDMTELYDLSFMGTFGENEKNEKGTMKKDYLKRLFDCRNVDMLDEKPQFIS